MERSKLVSENNRYLSKRGEIVTLTKRTSLVPITDSLTLAALGGSMISTFEGDNGVLYNGDGTRFNYRVGELLNPNDNSDDDLVYHISG